MSVCVMLDVDGVVVTGHPHDGRSWAADIEQDLGITPQDLQQHFFIPHWKAIVVGEKRLDTVLEDCLPRLAPDLTPQDFMAYWFARDARLEEDVLADCDLLRARGVKVFLATNQEHFRARHLMEMLGLSSRVDGIVYSAQVGAKKPQRAFFDAALSLAGSMPETTFLVDDTRANVDAARAAGWAACHWTGGQRLLELLETARAG